MTTATLSSSPSVHPVCREQAIAAAERERLILAHMRQVELIARRIHDRLPGSVSLDDLVSTGVLGLISAVDRFDESRGITLKTYAEHRIKGAILDSLRRLDWAPRRERKHAKQIDAAITVAQQLLQHAPSDEEVAATLNVTIDRYHQWQIGVSGLNPSQLDSPGTGDAETRSPIDYLSGDPSESPSALLECSELKNTVAAAISEMSAVEQTVLNLYYQGEMTLREIAKVVGLHESRISQIKAQAIIRLRTSMTKLWPAAGAR